MSKTALRKIKPEGVFDGKNKIKFGADGKAIKGETSEYMKQLRKDQISQDKDELKLIEESDVSDEDRQDKHL